MPFGKVDAGGVGHVIIHGPNIISTVTNHGPGVCFLGHGASEALAFQNQPSVTLQPNQVVSVSTDATNTWVTLSPYNTGTGTSNGFTYEVFIPAPSDSELAPTTREAVRRFMWKTIVPGTLVGAAVLAVAGWFANDVVFERAYGGHVAQFDEASRATLESLDRSHGRVSVLEEQLRARLGQATAAQDDLDAAVNTLQALTADVIDDLAAELVTALEADAEPGGGLADRIVAAAATDLKGMSDRLDALEIAGRLVGFGVVNETMTDGNTNAILSMRYFGSFVAPGATDVAVDPAANTLTYVVTVQEGLPFEFIVGTNFPQLFRCDVIGSNQNLVTITRHRLVDGPTVGIDTCWIMLVAD